MKEALLYNKLPNQLVQCQVCQHQCKIRKGQRGICSVRENQNGKLYALNYRRAISEAIDPIEKKPFFHFLPGSLSLSLATLGCNFRCDNCQNWQISQGSKGQGQIIGEDIAPADLVSHALAHRCLSLAYTYTEPTIFLEYALDTMILARQAGLKNVWVSNGYMSEKTRKLILPYLDAINVDLKFFDEQSYKKYCGGQLKPVLDNIIELKKNNVWVEVTTLSIPELSDSPELFDKISKFLVSQTGPKTPWHISRFSPEISYRLTNHIETTTKTLEQARQIGLKNGLNYVYLGNVFGHPAENTFCPNCQNLLIKRTGYIIQRFDQNGQCAKCHEKIDIITK